MNEEDRIRVATHINGDDAPSLKEWTGGSTGGTVPLHDVVWTGETVRNVLTRAGTIFLQLRGQFDTLPQFLAKFSDFLCVNPRERCL